MTVFKNSLISCQKCGRRIAVKARDFENGAIQCTHVGCGYINQLVQSYYDEHILIGLPSFGQLVYEANPTMKYPLRLGTNVVGTSPTCEVAVERFIHGDKCYISRRHCTIEVLFNKWTGRFRYQLQDGASDIDSHHYKNSLNGTMLNGYLLQNGEKMDLNDQGLLGLGGKDVFRLEAYLIPGKMLESYRISKVIEPDETQ
ncbi:FHA domain-containing protein [Cytophagaceae bacterium SJW1-29]|uniref:FHA domain-containing protein n=1 Tax=Salmonirosea aquatica TaxID=2654236 RepID=A0A7C9BG38_9BACT|nr:FHA domain-containing protein [Cytophagaceae bacterium SJW1-29]